MSLRIKLVLAIVALSTAATLVVGAAAYRTTARQLDDQLDRSLRSATERLVDRPRLRPDQWDRDRPAAPVFRGEGDVAVQLVGADGDVQPVSGVDLPVGPADLAIARAPRAISTTRQVTIGEDRYRMVTQGLGRGAGAVQAARSQAENERVLTGLRSRIFVLAGLVVLGAAGLGWLIAQQVTRRLVRLTAAAEQVTSTGDLAVEVPSGGSDEAGRLAAAFNRMLGALARSREDQQRLVQDAGHELRTPLTSLRTNVYALRRAEQLSADQRARLLDDLEHETVELTRLIDEVLELATDRRSDEPPETLHLGDLVRRVATRASQRSGRPIEVRTDDSAVTAPPLALERAVSNLVENALKFDPDGPIEVTCLAGTVEVADHGPGIAAEDLPHVFDRFYRATSARSSPGSGLGLAIVADIAARHGGDVHAHNRTGGGAAVSLRLPVAPAAPTPLTEP